MERIINANRASRTSISTLPEELLLQVFEASVEHDPYLTTRLLFVCRRWHNVAIKAPHLWASISFKFGNEWDMKCVAGKAKAMYMAHISRSGSNPLHIHIDIAGLKSSRDRLHDFISTYILSLEPGMDAERVMNARVDWPTSWTPPDDSPRNIIHICELFEWLKESDDVQQNRWETLSLALPQGKEEQPILAPILLYGSKSHFLHRLQSFRPYVVLSRQSTLPLFGSSLYFWLCPVPLQSQSPFQPHVDNKDRNHLQMGF